MFSFCFKDSIAFFLISSVCACFNCAVGIGVIIYLPSRHARCVMMYQIITELCLTADAGRRPTKVEKEEYRDFQ